MLLCKVVLDCSEQATLSDQTSLSFNGGMELDFEPQLISGDPVIQHSKWCQEQGVLPLAIVRYSYQRRDLK